MVGIPKSRNRDFVIPWNRDFMEMMKSDESHFSTFVFLETRKWWISSIFDEILVENDVIFDVQKWVHFWGTPKSGSWAQRRLGSTPQLGTIVPRMGPEMDPKSVDFRPIFDEFSSIFDEIHRNRVSWNTISESDECHFHSKSWFPWNHDFV